MFHPLCTCILLVLPLHIFADQINRAKINSLIQGGVPAPPPGDSARVECTSIDSVDITFVVDGSGSIATENFVKVKNFLNKLVTMLPGANYALVQYSSRGQEEFDFTQNRNYRQVIEKINAIRQIRGGTRTGAALQYVIDNLLTIDSGNNPNLQDVVIVLTDGKSSDIPADAAKILRDRGVKILGVGVGAADRAELISITGDESLVFLVDDFDKLDSQLSKDIMSVTECKVIVPTILTPVETCAEPVDIIFVIDGSGSISSINFNKVIDFLVMSLRQLPVEAWVAAVQYSSDYLLEFDFNQYPSREQQIAAIENMKQLKGGTMTGKALTFVNADLLVPSSGNRQDVKDIVVVLTDGKSQDNVAGPSQDLRDNGVKNLAVGVGNADDAELQQITGNADLVFMVSDFSALDAELSRQIMQAACPDVIEPCRQEVDLAIVLDSSGSIGSENFATVLDFTSKIVGVLPSASKIAALCYSTNVLPQFDFDRYADVSSAAAAILNVAYKRGLTYTGAALEYVSDSWGPGLAGNRPNVADIILVVTDGKATDSPIPHAQALRDSGATIIAVGVGNADQGELVGLTGDPDLVFMVGSFQELDDRLMKLVMMATGTCNADPENPDFTCEGKPDGPYVNPFDPCSPVWFTCNAGIRSKHHCNRGLRYDAFTGLCLLPQYNVGCGGVATTKSPGEASTLAPIDYNCMFLEDGNYENPKAACSEFFITCASGAAITRICPSGLLFDSLSRDCQAYEFARGCGGGPPPVPTVIEVPTVPVAVFDCELQDDGNYQLNSACSSQYISCSGGVGYYGNCVNGTFWDQPTALCLYREYVAACGGQATSPPVVVTYPPQEPPFPYSCVGKLDGGYNHPVLECSPLYVVCSNEHVVYLQCPNGLDYDIKSQACLHRDYILYCGGIPTTRGVPDPSTPQTPLFPFSCEGKDDGPYADPTQQCQPHFALCSGGLVFYQSCSQPLDGGRVAYDPISERCLREEFVVDCGGVATTPSPSVTATAGPPPFAFVCGVDQTGAFPNPENLCSPDYVVCSNGNAVFLTCPLGLHYDIDTEKCLIKDYILTCGGKPTIPDTVPPPSTQTPLFPFDCSSRDDGLYAAPSCQAYYAVCSGGLVYYQRCSDASLAFDQTSQLCLDRAYVADCGGSPTTPGPEVTYSVGPPPFAFSCGENQNGTFANPENPCSPDYVVCFVGRAVFLSCPNGLNYDVDSGRCLNSDYIQACGGSPTAPPSILPPSTQAPLFPFDCSSRDDGLYAAPSCQAYYAVCSGGLVYYQQCSDAALGFDQSSQLCLDRAYVADCGGSPTTPGPEVTYSVGPPPFAFVCGANQNGTFPNSENPCSPDYVVCFVGRAVFLSCPNGLNYDVDSGRCLNSDYIQACGGSPTAPPSILPPSTQAPLFPFDCSSRDDGLYAAPSCQAYYAVCSGGLVYYQQCSSAALGFDQTSQQCLDRAYVRDCGGSPTTPGPEVIYSVGPPPFAFECSDQPDATYGNPVDVCSPDYVICAGGHAIFLRCYGALKFDPLSGLCLVGAYVVACGGTATVSEAVTTSARPIVDFDCDSLADGFYPDLRSECSKVFFSCVGTFPYEMRCPGNTYYDVISGDCLRKKYVVACGGTATTRTTILPGADLTATPPPFDCWNLEDGNYPAPNVQCASFFYYCEARETYRVDCPGSSRFYNGECLHPAQVPSCLQGAGGDQCTGRPNGFYRDERRCNAYRICAEGINLEFSCLRGQVFDPETRQCKDPSEVYAPCGTKGPRNYFTCAHKKNGFYRAADACSTYCQCEDEKKSVLVCEDGLAYEPQQGLCIPAIFVDGCGPRPEQFYSDFCVQVGKSGIYSHPSSCEEFILCIQDFPLVLNCQYTFNKPGTPYWSEALKTCISTRPPGCEARRKRSARRLPFAKRIR